jgi:hypothetical protein
MVVVGGVKCTPYIISDATYSIRPYLKNWKICNVIDVDKHKYDSIMNSRRAVINNCTPKISLHKYPEEIEIVHLFTTCLHSLEVMDVVKQYLLGWKRKHLFDCPSIN